MNSLGGLTGGARAHVSASMSEGVGCCAAVTRMGHAGWAARGKVSRSEHTGVAKQGVWKCAEEEGEG